MTFLTACGANPVASQAVANSLEYTDESTKTVDGIGIAYYDITKNGVDECFVGPIKNALKGAAYEDSANPWFISYDEDEGWQNISKEEYDQRDYTPDQYEKLDFKPLSKIN